MGQSLIRKRGLVERHGDCVVVRLQGPHSHLLEVEGVVCENPQAAEGDRIYRKEFSDPAGSIYLSRELDRARREILGGHDVVVLGMTGYSSISEQKCQAWGVTMEAYIAACSCILGTAVRDIQAKFPGVRVKLADGASYVGVDKAQIEVAREANLDRLGHSCPEFLFYVRESDLPVYVAKDRRSYAEAFVQSVHILFSVGGRLQALEHDMLAAIKYDRKLILLNILEAISSHGGPPARDADGNIEDATAAFVRAISLNIPSGAHSLDHFENLCLHAASESVRFARHVISPERAFGSWRVSI